ncbi:GtrA family protein [Candidatus Pacearchaeota archaeon]|nr:GtrA family protein [Candidatus Pacearchaeota archaeon]
MRKTISEFLKFAIIGAINTAIHIGVLYILVDYLGVYYILASFIGFVLAVTNSFIMNTKFTFKRKIKEKTAERYTKFFVVSIIAAIVNLILLYIITEIFGVYYILSQLFATAGSLIINFMGNKLWTYKI